MSTENKEESVRNQQESNKYDDAIKETSGDYVENPNKMYVLVSFAPDVYFSSIGVDIYVLDVVNHPNSFRIFLVLIQ